MPELQEEGENGDDVWNEGGWRVIGANLKFALLCFDNVNSYAHEKREADICPRNKEKEKSETKFC